MTVGKINAPLTQVARENATTVVRPATNHLTIGPHLDPQLSQII